MNVRCTDGTNAVKYRPTLWKQDRGAFDAIKNRNFWGSCLLDTSIFTDRCLFVRLAILSLCSKSWTQRQYFFFHRLLSIKRNSRPSLQLSASHSSSHTTQIFDWALFSVRHTQRFGTWLCFRLQVTIMDYYG